MPRTPKEQWISGKEAIAILRANSGREDIRESYLRLLAIKGKIHTKAIDGRTNAYLKSDVEGYIVKRKNRGKGDTREARAAGSRRKPTGEEKAKDPAA